MAALFCECDDHCGEMIRLESEENRFLRRQSGYLMIPGHEAPDAEIIGEDSDGRFVYVAEREGRPARQQPIVH